MVESSKKVGPWREAVVTAAQMAGVAGLSLGGPLSLRVEFIIKRPLKHFTSKGLRPDAPTWVTTTPDLDKLLRSTKDGLVQAGVIWDDKLVAAGSQHKRYAGADETPGAIVEITRLVEGAC
jgi:crossover junction endodeoxyribonuclease RusA